jgi:hypothetical protein
VADAAADARHGVEQVGVGVARLAGEELDRAQQAAPAADREAERGAQAGLHGARAARQVGAGGDVGEPGRLPGGPDGAGQPLARREHRVPGRLHERGRAAPRLDAAQHAVLLLPQRARVPGERLADRREQLRVRGRLVLDLGQHAGDGMLGPEQDLGVGALLGIHVRGAVRHAVHDPTSRGRAAGGACVRR